MLQKALLILLGVSISKAIRLISHSRNGNQSVAVDASSEVIPATKYNVFLSFRGEDTRHTFASNLYKGLRDAGIHTFMDHKLQKGELISPVLQRIIKESEICVIIFSENYASSTWCLDELVHILECKHEFEGAVIPIFYNVDPSNIRKQSGNFGKGFDELKQRFKGNQEKLQKWRNALILSTSLSGWDYHTTRPEFKLVEEIVKDILSKLNRKSSSHVKGLVGIDHQIQQVEELLSEARTVGIWGMGGIGKSTLASAVFHRLKADFEAFCFVKDVRQQLEERNGLEKLQEDCLKELLKDDDINTYDLGSDFVRSRLQHKKILLILDDVHNSIAIEDLMKACDSFGEGSRIIMTSRDRHVLEDNSDSATYHVLKLDPHHALHLFSLNAFKQSEPLRSYLELSKQVVDYCQGNPLALKVLGRSLHGRGKEAWESALAKLNQTLNPEIFDVLKLSFDGLDDSQKNVFLDLAFLVGERWKISQNFTRCLYGPLAEIEISVLEERSLISVDEYDAIKMHALLVDVGRQISKQQLKSNSENFIRLWRHEDICRYFSDNDKGIDAIRCMSLDESKIDSITLTANHFRKMHYLMYLKVHKSDARKPSNLTIGEDLDYLSKELRFLKWDGYPWSQVPLQFCAENLIRLEMPESNIRQLWDRGQQFPNLKKVYLPNSKNLSALSDLSQAPKIEEMHLDGCVNLGQIHSSIVPEKDVYLSVRDCGPMQINVGHSTKGTSSGLVIVHNCLDVADLSLHKVTMKVFKCGNMRSGVRFKHVRVPLGQMAEMRVGIQHLASLLPFVRRVDWSECPIEFGDDFKQHHHTYDVDHCYNGIRDNFILGVRVRELMEDDEEEGDDFKQHHHTYDVDHYYSDTGEGFIPCEMVKELLEDEEEEDDDNSVEELQWLSAYHKSHRRYRLCSADYKSHRAYRKCHTLLTTVLLNSIPRWSLLVGLTLKESDINMIGKNADQVSIILKSLNKALSCTRRIQPLLALQLSSPTLSLLPHHNSFRVFYNTQGTPHVLWLWPSGLFLNQRVNVKLP